MGLYLRHYIVILSSVFLLSILSGVHTELIDTVAKKGHLLPPIATINCAQKLCYYTMLVIQEYVALPS